MIAPEDISLGTMYVVDAIKSRHSMRNFNNESLPLEELSYLLWSTQGIRTVVESQGATMRVEPSGGA
ncbi:MAG: hypothetical protein P1Q69_02940 [Candidatus Thorarchaeota archaeon]|nr:hypothetical protein [Candidatus Thorarchaeota archaeon]